VTIDLLLNIRPCYAVWVFEIRGFSYDIASGTGHGGCRSNGRSLGTAPIPPRPPKFQEICTARSVANTEHWMDDHHAPGARTFSRRTRFSCISSLVMVLYPALGIDAVQPRCPRCLDVGLTSAYLAAIERLAGTAMWRRRWQRWTASGAVGRQVQGLRLVMTNRGIDGIRCVSLP
jgi:hypothetical protein